MEEALLFLHRYMLMYFVILYTPYLYSVTEVSKCMLLYILVLNGLLLRKAQHVMPKSLQARGAEVVSDCSLDCSEISKQIQP